METSESLSIDSFSYSWLVNLKPSSEITKGSFRSSFDESNFIEMDPKLSPSKRFLVFHQDFNFDLPAFNPPVHADKLMSNGFLVPLFLNHSTPTSPMSSTTLTNVSSYRKRRYLSFTRYKTLPKRVVRKYLKLVRLVWVRMSRRKCETSELPRTERWDGFVDDVEPCGLDMWPRFWVFESPKCTPSPRLSEAYGARDLRRSWDSESSIYEAVLHCKKTFDCKSEYGMKET